MDHFFVVTNNQKDPELAVTRHIQDYLEKHGKQCQMDISEDGNGMEPSKEAECIIVLGGDGTLLRTARKMVARDIPLIGVNLGTLGYLAEVESGNLDQALDLLMKDEFTREKRMMLSGTTAEMKDYALNDIAITRKGDLQVNTINIYVNGMFLCTYHSDGVLVSTPTGSTGYNLSAGGPIVEPGAQLMLLTPICAHTLNSRTIILSPEDKIVVEIGENKKGMEQQLEACFDGNKGTILRTGDRLEICRSTKTTEIIKLSQASFVEVLHQKMKED